MRDPRIDPQNGDVLRKRGVLRRVIYREVNGMAGNTQMADCIQCLDGGHIKPPRERRPTLKQFRQWASGAVVEHAD